MGPLVGLGILREVLGARMAQWVEFIPSKPLVPWAGGPFLMCAARSVAN